MISLGIALLLTEVFPGRALIRTLVLLPWMLPPIVNGFLWGWVLNGEYGALNGLLYQFGWIDEYITWLKNPDTQILWLLPWLVLGFSCSKGSMLPPNAPGPGPGPLGFMCR